MLGHYRTSAYKCTTSDIYTGCHNTIRAHNRPGVDVRFRKSFTRKPKRDLTSGDMFLRRNGAVWTDRNGCTHNDATVAVNHRVFSHRDPITKNNGSPVASNYNPCLEIATAPNDNTTAPTSK